METYEDKKARLSKPLRVHLCNTEGAGYFYTNIISNVVSIVGLKARYQQGNSGGEKRHFWFINDDDVNPDKLPQKAWGFIEGNVITDEQKDGLMGTDVPTSETTETTAKAPF